MLPLDPDLKIQCRSFPDIQQECPRISPSNPTLSKIILRRLTFDLSFFRKPNPFCTTPFMSGEVTRRFSNFSLFSRAIGALKSSRYIFCKVIRKILQPHLLLSSLFSEPIFNWNFSNLNLELIVDLYFRFSRKATVIFFLFLIVQHVLRVLSFQY